MSAKQAEEKDRYVVPGLERGLKLLTSFTAERPVIGLGDLAREHGLPRTTVFRLAHTLETLGYLRRDEGGKSYRLGPAVLGLGFAFLSSLELPEIARPALESLRDDTAASAHLAIRDGDQIVYVSRYASRSALASNIRVGSRLPAHASSMGRMLLADLDDAELDALYTGRALERHSDQTPGNLADLKTLLDGDRARGYVVSRSFYERGVVSVAAAIRDGSGRAVGAINITAAEQSVDPAALDGALVARVLDAADTISRWLGYSAPRVSRAV